MKKETKKINWKRALKNNAFMLGILKKACPALLVLDIITVIMFSVNSFLLNTYLFKYALDALQTGEEVRKIIITVCCIVVYSLICRIVGNFSNVIWQLKEPKVEAYIQNMLQKKVSTVDLACFESSEFYDKYVKAIDEVTNRAYTVWGNILDVIWIAIYVFSTGALVFTIDPIFIITALLPLAFTLLLGKKRNRIKYDYDMENKNTVRRRDYVRRTFYLNDFSKEMRLTSMYKVMKRRMKDTIAEMKSIVDKYGCKMMFFRFIFEFVFDTGVYALAVVISVFRTLVSKTMSAGDCFVVINSIGSLAGNVNYIGDMVLKLDENSLYIENLRELLEYEVKIAEDKNAPLVPRFESLELCNVTFGYEGQKNNALSDVAFKIKRGEKIAIVGHNGAGKTTLIKLLLRLYDPSDGQILINGVDIRNYRLSSYRNMFGTVFQDYRLFSATVAENVLLRGNITDDDREKAVKALRLAGVYSKIDELPRGVDTMVTKEFDEAGVVFSGGEAQKISIARIFAGEQEIVIMDEPTSALDPIAENDMYNNMFEACRGKTVIFISHRLSSATMADSVYMFENGRIIEQGTHGDLLRLNGKYADMWRKQADSYSKCGEVTE